MQYKKWTFTTVPNIEYLKWKNPILQVIYMWICKYSNDDWVCFPSVSTLAKNCWTSSNSIRKYLKELEKLGILQRERRFKNNEETSSIYELIIWGTSPAEGGTAPAEGGGTSPDGNRTKSNYLTKSTELKEKKSKEFKFQSKRELKEFITEMYNKDNSLFDVAHLRYIWPWIEKLREKGYKVKKMEWDIIGWYKYFKETTTKHCWITNTWPAYWEMDLVLERMFNWLEEKEKKSWNIKNTILTFLTKSKWK